MKIKGRTNIRCNILNAGKQELSQLFVSIHLFHLFFVMYFGGVVWYEFFLQFILQNSIKCFGSDNQGGEKKLLNIT